AGGGRRRPGAGPTRPDHHGDRSELVLGLNDGVGGLARFWIASVRFEVVDATFAEARARCDRVPGENGDASEHQAEPRRLVALDDDLSFGQRAATQRDLARLGE